MKPESRSDDIGFDAAIVGRSPTTESSHQDIGIDYNISCHYDVSGYHSIGSHYPVGRRYDIRRWRYISDCRAVTAGDVDNGTDDQIVLGHSLRYQHIVTTINDIVCRRRRWYVIGDQNWSTLICE